MNRLQHILPAGFIAAVGIWICYVSYTQEPADAFLFPRLISTAFVVLALWAFAKTVGGTSEEGAGISIQMARNLAPGFVVMLIYAFWAAKALGFYTATTIAFFIVLSLYDPASHREIRSWGRRVLITAGFVVVMYGLFAQLLKVYTPREILF